MLLFIYRTTSSRVNYTKCWARYRNRLCVLWPDYRTTVPIISTVHFYIYWGFIFGLLWFALSILVIVAHQSKLVIYWPNKPQIKSVFLATLPLLAALQMLQLLLLLLVRPLLHPLLATLLPSALAFAIAVNVSHVCRVCRWALLCNAMRRPNAKFQTSCCLFADVIVDKCVCARVCVCVCLQMSVEYTQKTEHKMQMWSK